MKPVRRLAEAGHGESSEKTPVPESYEKVNSIGPVLARSPTRGTESPPRTKFLLSCACESDR